MSPAPLEIRRLRCAFTGEDPAWFIDNLIVSAFLNVMSITFSVVEPLFIQAVRSRRDALDDPALLADVAGFVGQEAQHAKLHLSMNRWIATLGYPVEETSQLIQGVYAELRDRQSADELLAYVASFEHITTVVSAFTLSRPFLFREGDDANVAIQWHMLEEVEHKHVGFDVYQACVGDLSLRRRAMLSALLGFFVMMNKALYQQLRGRRLTLSDWRTGGYWALRSWGALAWSTLDYMRAGFHPNDADHSALTEDWQRRYPGVAARAARLSAAEAG